MRGTAQKINTPTISHNSLTRMHFFEANKKQYTWLFLNATKGMQHILKTFYTKIILKRIKKMYVKKLIKIFIQKTSVHYVSENTM